MIYRIKNSRIHPSSVALELDNISHYTETYNLLHSDLPCQAGTTTLHGRMGNTSQLAIIGSKKCQNVRTLLLGGLVCENILYVYDSFVNAIPNSPSFFFFKS